jgi:hypothetical protein
VGENDPRAAAREWCPCLHRPASQDDSVSMRSCRAPLFGRGHPCPGPSVLLIEGGCHHPLTFSSVVRRCFFRNSWKATSLSQDPMVPAAPRTGHREHRGRRASARMWPLPVTGAEGWDCVQALHWDPSFANAGLARPGGPGTPSSAAGRSIISYEKAERLPIMSDCGSVG